MRALVSDSFISANQSFSSFIVIIPSFLLAYVQYMSFSDGSVYNLCYKELQILESGSRVLTYHVCPSLPLPPHPTTKRGSYKKFFFGTIFICFHPFVATSGNPVFESKTIIHLYFSGTILYNSKKEGKI